MKILKEQIQDLHPNRWEEGRPHHPRSIEIMDALEHIDLTMYGDAFCWKRGGDGDNGESLQFELDIYFESLDRAIESAPVQAGGLPEGCPSTAAFSETWGFNWSHEPLDGETPVEIHPVGTRARLSAPQAGLTEREVCGHRNFRDVCDKCEPAGLTSEEREAIQAAIDYYSPDPADGDGKDPAQILRDEVRRCWRLLSTRESRGTEGLAKLRAALEADAADLWKVTNAIKDAIQARRWVTDTRGSYAWDDQRYMDETRLAFEEVLAIIDTVQPPASKRYLEVMGATDAAPLRAGESRGEGEADSERPPSREEEMAIMMRRLINALCHAGPLKFEKDVPDLARALLNRLGWGWRPKNGNEESTQGEKT